jgi:GAF domain-containing protein
MTHAPYRIRETPAYAAALDNAENLAEIGEVVRSAARSVTGADGATFVLRDGDLCFYADEDAIAPLWKGQRFPMSQCVSGWAMLHRESVTIPDIELDERVPIVAYRPTFVRSMVMSPIGRDRPVGAIGVYWAHIRQHAADCVAALESLADATADAIARVGLDDAPWAPNFSLPGGSIRPGADF